MKIYKNFIKKEYSNKINDELLKPYFHGITIKVKRNDTSFMSHIFHTMNNSDYFHLVNILEKLIKCLINVIKIYV